MADAPSPHGLNSEHHTGTLDNAQIPQALLTDGSRTVSGNLPVASGVTVDGVDLSVLKNNYDIHLGSPTAHNYIRNLLDDAGVAAPKGVTTNDVKIYGDGDITVTKTVDGLLVAYTGGGGGGSGSFSGIKDPAGTGVVEDGTGYILTTDDGVVNVDASGANTLAFSVNQANISHANIGGVSANQHHNQQHVFMTNAGLGPDHTVSGLTASTFLRATSATSLAFGNIAHSELQAVTADQHHAQQHVLATNTALGPDHTVSGLTSGQVLRASGATTALFGNLAHSETGGIGANDHHNQSHVLATASALGADHTISGATAGHVLRASSATAAAFSQLAHTELSSIGSNTHAQIDSHIASTVEHGATGAVVGTTNTQTLTNKTLTTPTIGDFTNSVHAHANAAGGGLVSHAVLSNVVADEHIAHSGVTLTAGDGLTGGGTIAASRNFAIGTPGAATSTSTDATTADSHTHSIDATIARSAITITAGAGLTGGGDLTANRTLNIGAGLGITVNVDDVALTTPGTLTVATSSSSSGNHTHAVTSSSNPGAAASLVATDASGKLNLAVLGVGGLPAGSDKFNVTGNATLDSATFEGTVTITDDLTVAYAGYYPLYVNVNTVTPGNSNVGIMKIPDAQFALDIYGSMRVDGGWIVGKHALQLADATMIVHFDGPNPFNTNFSGFSAGHMGQVGTETGGVIYRPGKFGKAVQVAEATTNLLPNPSFEVDTSNWGVSAVTLSQQSNGYIGSYCMRVAYNGSGDGYAAGTTDTGASLVGRTFTFQFRARLSQAGAFTPYANPQIQADGGDYSGTGISISGLTREWQYFSLTHTFGAGATTNYVRAILRPSNSTSAPHVEYDAVQIEEKAYATPYCDGSQGQGHTWSGTAHVSTSSRTAASVSYSNANNSVLRPDVGTMAMWFYRDGGVGGNNSTYGVVSWNGDASLWNFMLQKSTSIDAFYFIVNDGTEKQPWSGTLNRFQWYHLALTWDSTTAIVYLNGVNVGSVAAGALRGNGGTFYPGIKWDGSNSNVLVDDVVLLSRAAAAVEIKAIYESNAPVFAESSVFAFRAPSRSAFFVDEEGVWMRSYSGNATLGIYAGDVSKSWGGRTLYDSDLLIGNSTAGYVHWHSGVDADDTTYYGSPSLQIAGRMHVKSDSTFDGTISVGTSGGIYQGTGTFANPTTGLKIWNDSGIGRIGGYNSGTAQWYASTDGKLYAGAGAVTLDANGMSIVAGTGTANKISWFTSGLQKGSLNAQTLSNENYLFATAAGTDVTNAQGRLYLSASPFDIAHKAARVEIASATTQSTVLHYAQSHLFYLAAGGTALATINTSGLALTGSVTLSEMTAPAAPAANNVVLYAVDDGYGKTKLMALFPSGVAQQVAAEPGAVGVNYRVTA